MKLVGQMATVGGGPMFPATWPVAASGGYWSLRPHRGKTLRNIIVSYAVNQSTPVATCLEMAYSLPNNLGLINVLSAGARFTPLVVNIGHWEWKGPESYVNVEIPGGFYIERERDIYLVLYDWHAHPDYPTPQIQWSISLIFEPAEEE